MSLFGIHHEDDVVPDVDPDVDCTSQRTKVSGYGLEVPFSFEMYPDLSLASPSFEEEAPHTNHSNNNNNNNNDRGDSIRISPSPNTGAHLSSTRNGNDEADGPQQQQQQQEQRSPPLLLYRKRKPKHPNVMYMNSSPSLSGHYVGAPPPSHHDNQTQQHEQPITKKTKVSFPVFKGFMV